MPKIIYKKAPKTLAKLKRELVTVLHKYIRLRDSNGANFTDCISCGRSIPTSEGHAGHFIPSTYASVRFSEFNINFQCKNCNVWKRGNIIEYRPRLIQKIGKEQVEALENMRHDTFKQPREWYEEKIQYYKQKLESLTK